jgi:hypothetical protein
MNELSRECSYYEQVAWMHKGNTWAEEREAANLRR